MKNNKSFGYYFLNKRLHPQTPSGYRTSIVILIVNKNKTANRNKFLLVQQENGFWNLPKEGIEASLLVEDLYTTVARNLDEELGFKGVKVTETKPLLTQICLIYNIAKQKYSTSRSIQEKQRNRPYKGKIYQLAVMEYLGPDEIPLSRNNKEIQDYQWVSTEKAKEIMKSNRKLLEEKKVTSPDSIEFNITLFETISEIYESVTKSLSKKDIRQPRLI